MKKVSFEEFKNEVVDSLEFMNEQEDIYEQEEIDSVFNTESFSELSEILVDIQYWEESDVVDYARSIK